MSKSLWTWWRGFECDRECPVTWERKRAAHLSAIGCFGIGGPLT